MRGEAPTLDVCLGFLVPFADGLDREDRFRERVCVCLTPTLLVPVVDEVPATDDRHDTPSLVQLPTQTPRHQTTT